MILHHPEDKMCWHIDNQYYFGDAFLVAPIMNSENIRDIYLPDGEWVDFFTGQTFDGGKWIRNYESDMQNMPVFVKTDTQIPIYPEVIQCTDEMDLTKTTEIIIDRDFSGIWNYIEK
jgi:alpha-D-xyloside xylohydrolase